MQSVCILWRGVFPLLTHTLTHSLISTQSDVYSPDGKCASWKEWSEIAEVHSDLGSYLFNYSIYVFIAVIFAGVAGLYVITLAPYASGSGIPEVTSTISPCCHQLWKYVYNGSFPICSIHSTLSIPISSVCVCVCVCVRARVLCMLFRVLVAYCGSS